MSSINIRIGHDDNFVISKVFYFKIGSDARSQRRDKSANLFAGNHFFRSGFFNIEYFTSHRQNSLEPSITTLLCSSSRRVSLYDINFRKSGIFF